jgi:hypothetical protein
MGMTYLTFAGADPANPGVTRRDPTRKWGHYDSEIPVYVLGVQIQGALTSASAIGSYTLRIKNFDHVGGLGLTLNAGAVVSSLDVNSVANSIAVNDPKSYWRDFDSSGTINSVDFNMLVAHFNHDCDTPQNP